MPALVALAVLLMGGVLVALHGYTLRWPFISDDYIFLTKSRSGAFEDLFLSFNVVQNYFRPLGRELFFFGVSRFAGNDPLPFRLVNLGVLTLVIGLVVALAWRLGAPRAALLAGGAYALLYPHSVLMGWVSCSQDLVATTLGLAAALLHFRARPGLAAGAYFLALFAKESVAPLPLVLALGEAWEARGPLVARARRALQGTLGLWIAAAVWAALVVAARVWKQAWVPGDTLPVADVTLEPGSFLEGLRSALLTYVYLDQPWHYLREAIAGMTLPWIAMGLAAAIAVLASLVPRAAATTTSRPGTMIRLGAIWALVAALPPALAGHHFSGYYVTFAAVGFALVVGALLARAPLPVTAGILALAAAANVAANRVDSFRITRLQPEPPGVSFVTVSRLKVEVRFLEALHRALRENPPPRGAAIYLSNAPRGITFATQGSNAPKVWFEDPTLDLTYIGRFEPHAGARPAVFLRFDFDRWGFTPVPQRLVEAIVQADASMGRGDWPAARAALERALAIVPANPYGFERTELLNSLGVAANQLGDTESARRAWAEALALTPDHRGALLNLAGLEAGSGRFAEARQRIATLLEGQPDDPLALYYLARLERALGRPDDAERAWQRLVEAHPRYADSLARVGAPR